MTCWLTPEEREQGYLRSNATDAGLEAHAKLLVHTAEADRRLAALRAELSIVGDERDEARADKYLLIAEVDALRADLAEADRRLAERDDVIRELSEALREGENNMYQTTHRDSVRVYEEWRKRARAALARVDAMGGEHADA